MPSVTALAAPGRVSEWPRSLTPPRLSGLDPDVVLVKPVEQYVRAVHHASNFQRFQVPHKDRQVPPEDLFSIVGPCILAHDHGNNKSDPTYTHRGRSVVNGSSTTPKFCIDSGQSPTPLRLPASSRVRSSIDRQPAPCRPEASRNVKAAVKASGRSLLPADDRFRRVAWTLVSPDPTDEPLEHVVTEPGGHQHLWHVPGVEPSKGYLPRGWAPASEVAWLLEVTLRGVAASARNEVTFFRVVFSRDFRAEEIEAGSLSLGKGGFFPRARGPQRVQTLQ